MASYLLHNLLEWSCEIYMKMVLSQKLLMIIGALVTLATLGAPLGCGPKAFIKVPSTQTQTSPGTYTVPPKVDILLIEDNTGSAMEIFNNLSNNAQTFLQHLQSSGWDYHFAAIPLTTDQAITQVTASTYDANYGSSWTSPYPGANSNNLENISSSVFVTMSNYINNGLLHYSDLSNGLDGDEPGFYTIDKALHNRVSGTGFSREDALLVVLVVGNGNDTSGVTICKRPDQYQGPCEQLGYSNPAAAVKEGVTCSKDGKSVVCPSKATGASSLAQYKSDFLNLKSDSSEIKFFAGVAQQSQCLGQTAIIGSRYQDMASQLGGQTYDICSQSLSSVFTSLASSLASVRYAYQIHYLFVSQEPDPSTIQVIRYPNGDQNAGVTLNQDSQNGWTYAGYVTNVYTIDSPMPMDQASGYAIELHGTAELSGNDTASITYTPKDGTTTASK